MNNRDKRMIRDYIKRNAPEHLHGYDEGWLGFHYFEDKEGNFQGYHIFSFNHRTGESDLVGTVMISLRG